MKRQLKHPGITLTEVLVVTAVLVILLGISVPAAKKIIDSFDSSTGARSLINAALSSARAMAMSSGRYAGVRFQENRAGDPYLIFIQYPEAAGTGAMAYAFHAVPGRKPIKLPQNVGVMDGTWVDREIGAIGQFVPADSYEYDLVDADLANTANPARYRDATTFSIVFSPSGHVVTQELRVCNRQLVMDAGAEPYPADSIFNWMAVVDAGDAMFYQDDYGDPGAADYRGIGPEMSRKGFILFDKRKYREINPAARWTGYLEDLTPEVVSPYTGELIKRFEGNH